MIAFILLLVLIIKGGTKAGGVAQVVKHLLSKHETLSSNPNTT
jgi:hypothetical protein